VKPSVFLRTVIAAQLHATTPAAHPGQGERVILPTINRSRQAPRRNFEEQQPGQPEEEDAKSHKGFLCMETGPLEAETTEEWPAR